MMMLKASLCHPFIHTDSKKHNSQERLMDPRMKHREGETLDGVSVGGSPSLDSMIDQVTKGGDTAIEHKRILL